MSSDVTPTPDASSDAETSPASTADVTPTGASPAPLQDPQPEASGAVDASLPEGDGASDEAAFENPEDADGPVATDGEPAHDAATDDGPHAPNVHVSSGGEEADYVDDIDPESLTRFMPVRCAVVTVDQKQDEETDRIGSLIRVKLMRSGHDVMFYQVVPQDDKILELLTEQLPGKAEVAIFSSGNDLGVNATHQVLAREITTPLPGFGEFLRRLAYKDLGPRAMMIQASAGLLGNMLVYALPQSMREVRRALDELILPQLRPTVWEHIRHLDIKY